MKNFWTTLPRPIVALAPMEGVTDSAFRQLCRHFGADVVYTEFISSDAIDHRAPSALRKMDFHSSEQPVVCQIFGRNPDAFRRAAQEVERRGFAGIDLNFGCPARKVMSHGSGVSLMRDPQYARQLIESVMEAVSIPVSIKVRASIRREAKEVDPTCTDRVTAADLVAAIKDLPVAAIMVHGRSYEQGFTGSPDTAMIARVKQAFDGIVLANGGIHSADDGERILQASGADGVGVARGSVGRPTIFTDLRDRLRPDEGPTTTTETAEIIIRHADLILATKGERGLVEIRKHLSAYVTGLPNATAFRRRLSAVSTQADIAAFAGDVKIAAKQQHPD